jgi:translation elongation factor EF-4
MTPRQVQVNTLGAGEVGYICGSIKDVLDARVGDTIVLSKQFGFLGLLHMEIVNERLAREYDLALIMTAPSVVYKIKMGGEEYDIDSPSKMPDLTRDHETLEPYVRMEILTPSEYNGAIIELGQE